MINVINALRREFRHTIAVLDGNSSAAPRLHSESDVVLRHIDSKKTRLISVANVRLARQVLHKLKPDLMLTYNWGSVEWTLSNVAPRVCPHIHLESGFGFDESPDNQHRRRVLARRILLKRCDQVIVPSLTLYKIATQTWRLSAARVTHIPNGIDLDRFRPPTMSLGQDTNAPIIGTVAALRPEKNLSCLIQAFSLLPSQQNARLMIVGDGPELLHLRETTWALGVADRVSFIGRVDDPSRLLSQFDIFALSSKTEQMPNSVLEAMAMGLPVVSTDVGDVKHILAAENAPFVVPIGDSKSFAEAISRLLSDKVVAQSIGRANRMRAQNEFDIKTMIARYESLFFEYTSPIADSLRLKGDETAAKSPSVSRLREWHLR